ncbi:MAG: cell division protein ZapE [Gordonia sp. (in: high G+C Gram-positive bacteria)]|uniref:cell division protein ZapE n=1 Tax=Gordonia sp. (in: high G+C Gram-positive bacteria) TaxID=84139 RepID=UPI0039E4E373
MNATAIVAAAAGRGVDLDPMQRLACEVLAGEENVYLAGPAGRGKTLLMDSYVALLPPGGVVRIHWHEFVRDINDLIRQHGSLGEAIEGLLGEAGVFCFDELHVDDPADGVFLDSLIRELVDRRVRLVVTSNLRPAELMPNPLFHDTFAPTIDLITRTCAVVDLDAGVDYRSGVEHSAGFASGRWSSTNRRHGAEEVHVIGTRRFSAWDRSREHLGVSFRQICETPLSSTDYLELAKHHSTWTVSDVPDLADVDREAAQRFVHLIDVLYDQDVPLTIESDVPRDEFSVSGRLPVGAERMRSRLSTLR